MIDIFGPEPRPTGEPGLDQWMGILSQFIGVQYDYNLILLISFLFGQMFWWPVVLIVWYVQKQLSKLF